MIVRKKKEQITVIKRIKRWCKNHLIFSIYNNIKSSSAILFGSNININNQNCDTVEGGDLLFNYNLTPDQIKEVQKDLSLGINYFDVQYTEAYLMLYLFSHSVCIGFRTKGKLTY